MDFPRIIDEYFAAGGGPCALATIVETIGPAYRRAGARQIIRRDGKTWGAITGGCLEADLILHAVRVIESNQARLTRYTPSDDDPLFGLGSGCGGEIGVLLEPVSESSLRELRRQFSDPAPGHDAIITIHGAADPLQLGSFTGVAEDAPSGALVQPIVPPLSLAIFGASPAAPALTRMGRELGWRVTLIDHRPAVASDERFAAADKVLIAPASEQPSIVARTKPCAAIVMTHHYRRDLEILAGLLPQSLSYVGLVGSRDRAHRMTADLRALGVSAEDLERLHAPAGLDFDADTPAEIALSILAEIQAVHRGATAIPLGKRRGTIHQSPQRDAIAILAAGGSRRMGAPKQLLTVDGRSLVRRAVETALEAGPSFVFVVAGPELDSIREELTGLPVQLLANREWPEGIASSIRVVVERAEGQADPVEMLTLMLCDQPGVSPEVLKRLRDVHRKTRAPVVASRYPDGPGVPALFRDEMFPELKSLRGDIGARQLIRNLQQEVVTIPFDAPGDLDTPADFVSWQTAHPNGPQHR